MIFLMLMNMANFIYIGLSEPHVTRKDRRTELFNEFMVRSEFIFILTATEAVTDPEL